MTEEIYDTDITTVLAEVSGAVVGYFEMDMLLDQIINMTMKILQAEVCSIFLEDKEKEPGVIRCVAGSGFAKKIVGIANYKIGEGYTGTVAKTGEGYNSKSREDHENISIDNNKVWRGKFDDIQWPSGVSEFRNGIALPLKIKEQILGVIKAENKIGAEYFTNEDLAIFKTIASVIALTIENARLHQVAERQLKTISAKAAHRINNQAANYDGIDLDLALELESSLIDRDNVIDIHKRLQKTTKNLKNMIGEFRDFGKPIVLQKKICSLNKIIRDEVRHAKPSGIVIKDTYDENIPDFPLDEARFAESMKELLSNAIRALKSSEIRDGQINVTTKLTPTDNKEFAVICIEDNGPGFPPNFPVFEPFTSTYPEGTGLGLSTVKELVEKHGGTVSIKASSLGGANVECLIPITN